MDRFNFNHLFYFYLVAKEGSVKEAAHKIHVSQPTVSDQIRLLEEYFGAKLFDRKNRALVLNEAGKKALEYAEKIFEMARELTATIRNEELPAKDSIDLGVTHLMSQYFVYDRILPLFRSSQMSVKIKEGERSYLLADLEEGRLDVVFTDTKESILSKVSAHRVGLNRTFAVAHRDFTNNQVPFPDNLNSIPYFGYTSESLLKSEIELFFTSNGLSPTRVGEADDIDLMQMITEKGLAFTIVPEVAKDRFCASGAICVLGELTELQTSVWALMKQGPRTAAKDLLLQNLLRLEA